MAAEPTARDALIAEMLGDIGKLHDAVESLKTVLPGQTEAVESKIAGLIGLLQKAGDTYKGQIEAYTNAQGDKVRAQMEKDASAAKVRFERDSSDAIRAALAEIERTVKGTVQSEISAPVQGVLRTLQRNAWKNLATCFACGLLGGLVVIGVYAVVHDKQQDAYTDLGKAVTASWEKLDSKAKATINAERRP